MEISKTHKELLQHMLGADSRYKKKQWGFRNHFCACEGHSDLPELQKMEKLGLVKSGERMNSITYWATRAGAIAIGFKPYQLKNMKRLGTHIA